MKIIKKHPIYAGICRGITVILTFLLSVSHLFGQSSGSITVGGNINTFYPVAWIDGNYFWNKNTNLTIARDVHTDVLWRGSMVGEFTFRTDNWGAGSQFVDVKLSSFINNPRGFTSFVAGWEDATPSNGDRVLIIWLRGGGTTYYYSADADVNPKVHDGTQYTLPYVSSNGNYSVNAKTALDPYAVAAANSFQLPLNVYGANSNFMQGNLGIGRRNPTEKLEVSGRIRAEEIKVEASPWPDFVFEDSYQLPSLLDTEMFIKEKGHLPNIPTAQEVEVDGVALGKMNALLLQKIEELTLHLIAKDKAITILQEQVSKLMKSN